MRPIEEHPARNQASEQVRAALAAAHSSQGAFNAFTLIEDDHANALAAEIGPEDGRLLAGVPIALKDLIDQQGFVTTCGSAFYREMASRDATVVERLEEAGGVIIGRTGLHEWAFGFNSENPHFGPVRNPWDPATSTGGSSGGSGAAVAAGIVPLAIGTDTGGSVRVPAALCGCFGLKTTYGNVPLDGVHPLVPSIDTVGPLAKSVDYLERCYRVIAADHAPLPVPGSMRIGIPQPWVDTAPGMSADVRLQFDSAVSRLEELGHEVETIDVPAITPPGRILDAIGVEVTEVHSEFRAEGKEYGDDVAERIDAAAAVEPMAAEEARLWQTGLRADFAEVFGDIDLLVTPTTPAMRKTIGERDIDGVHHRVVLSWFTALVNHALLPAITMPLVGPGAPPVSLQLIGPMESDLLLLASARQLEKAGLVGFGRPTQVS